MAAVQALEAYLVPFGYKKQKKSVKAYTAPVLALPSPPAPTSPAEDEQEMNDENSYPSDDVAAVQAAPSPAMPSGTSRVAVEPAAPTPVTAVEPSPLKFVSMDEEDNPTPTCVLLPWLRVRVHCETLDLRTGTVECRVQVGRLRNLVHNAATAGKRCKEHVCANGAARCCKQARRVQKYAHGSGTRGVLYSPLVHPCNRSRGC